MLVARTMVVAVSILASACCKKDPPPPPSTPPCEQPGNDNYCGTGSCGANSPTINGFPINGLRANGECNTDGVQLVPGSMAGGRCTGATLDVKDNALVGRNDKGDVQCEGDDLAGASFEVRSWETVSPSDPTKRSLRIKIAAIAPHPHPGGETRTGYRMVRADGPGDASLCSAQASTDARLQLGLKAITGLGSESPTTEDVVIPVVSELYDKLGTPVEIKPGWRLRGRSWLNLACAGDALAERSLYHLHTDNLLRSRTAIRMLTANYCGDKPFTMRGMKVAWGAGPSDHLEARWSERGATCLGKPRVIFKDAADPQKVPEYLPPELRKICDKAECPNLDAWLAAAHLCKKGSEIRTLPPCDPQVSDPDPFPSFIVLPGESVRP